MTVWGGLKCPNKSVLSVHRHRRNVKTIVWRGPNHGFGAFGRGGDPILAPLNLFSPV